MGPARPFLRGVENPLHVRRAHFEPSSINAETTNSNLSAFLNMRSGQKDLSSVYNTSQAFPTNYQQDYFPANQNQKLPNIATEFPLYTISINQKKHNLLMNLAESSFHVV